MTNITDSLTNNPIATSHTTSSTISTTATSNTVPTTNTTSTTSTTSTSINAAPLISTWINTSGNSSSSSSNSSGGGANSNNNSNHEPCLICGDVASGKHYGLRSCEACKAFFKRTVQGKIEYSCPATRECEINKRRRKACQACRFQKCLNMGMLKEGVRLDRVRGGRQKYRRGISPTPGGGGGGGGASGTSAKCLASSSISVINSSSNNRANPSSSSATTKAANALTNASVVATHQQTAIGTGETSKIMTALINCEPEELSAAPGQYITSMPPNISVQLKTLHILSDLFDRELVSLIGWAKQIPGFSETITLNDQMRLLQSTWAEVIALSIGYRSHLKRIENDNQQQHQQQQQHQHHHHHHQAPQHGNRDHHHFMNATTPSPASSSPASTSSSSYNNSIGSTNTSPNYNLGNTEIRLVFAKDLIIDFKHAITCGAEEIFYNCVQLIKRLDYLKITPKEYILLKAISLTNADVRLENPKATFRLRDLVMDALYEVTLTECLNGGDGGGGGASLIGQDGISSVSALIKQEAASGNSSGGGHQVKIEAQERPPSSMNQYASSSSSPIPPSRSSSSVPSSSSISSISTHNNSNNNTNNDNDNDNNNNNNNTNNINNLDMSNKKTIINNRMNQVLLCLPVLRQIDTCIRKFWNDIRKGPNNVPMNKLFEEMLEPCQRMYRSSFEM